MKLPLTQEQTEWFQNATPIEPIEPNPCIRLFGPGPEGEQCKTCSHLYKHHIRYYKCDLRRHTNGPGSDHRVRWDACAKYNRR